MSRSRSPGGSILGRAMHSDMNTEINLFQASPQMNQMMQLYPNGGRDAGIAWRSSGSAKSQLRQDSDVSQEGMRHSQAQVRSPQAENGKSEHTSVTNIWERIVDHTRSSMSPRPKNRRVERTSRSHSSSGAQTARIENRHRLGVFVCVFVRVKQ